MASHMNTEQPLTDSLNYILSSTEMKWGKHKSHLKIEHIIFNLGKLCCTFSGSEQFSSTSTHVQNSISPYIQ